MIVTSLSTSTPTGSTSESLELYLDTSMILESIRWLDQESLMSMSVTSKRFNNMIRSPNEMFLSPSSTTGTTSTTTSSSSSSSIRNTNLIIPIFELRGSSTQKFLNNLSQYHPPPQRHYNPRKKTGTVHSRRRSRRLQHDYPIVRILDVSKFDTVPFGPSDTILKKLPKMEGTLVLDLSVPTLTELDDTNYYSQRSLIDVLIYLLPNLQEVDLTNLGVSYGVLVDFCSEHCCPHLHTIRWNYIDHRYSWVNINGSDLQYSSHGITDLIMDDGEFWLDRSELESDNEDNATMNNNPTNTSTNPASSSSSSPSCVLFRDCKKSLERVSIRNAQWYTYSVHHGYSEITEIPQTTLVQFIRSAPPSLRYFRSNLSSNNIKMLRTERPEIQLVN